MTSIIAFDPLKTQPKCANGTVDATYIWGFLRRFPYNSAVKPALIAEPDVNAMTIVVLFDYKIPERRADRTLHPLVTQ